jgi:apolipoprotein N-acyltransferase
MFDTLTISLYILALVSLVGLVMRKSRLAHTKKEAVTLWVIFGFSANFITLSSYYTVLPLEGVPSLLGILLATFVVVLLAIPCGMMYSLIGALAFRTRRSLTAQLWTISFGVVVVEVLRAHILPLVLWGGGSLLGAHGSSWTYGEILSITPLLSFAQFGGTATLSGVLVFMVGLCVYPFTVSKKILTAFTVLAVSCLINLPSKTISPEKELRVAIVQTAFGHIPADQDIDKAYAQQVREMRSLVLSLASTSPDIVVLPEDSRFITLQNTSEKTELRTLFPNTLFIDGTTQVTRGGRKNRAVFFDTKSNTTTFRDKGFLFPFGEYLPYSVEPLLRLFAGNDAVSNYKREHEYVSGTLPHSVATRFGTIGILICSELTSFTSINALANSNPDIVFAQSSLTWLHDKPYFVMGHIFSLKIASQILHKPIISVSNDGPSIVVDKQGKVVYFKEKTLSASVFELTGNTVQEIK